MGWISVGGCTLLGGYALYTFGRHQFSRIRSKKANSVPDDEDESDGRIIQTTASRLGETGLESEIASPPVFDVTPPVAVENEKMVTSLALKHTGQPARMLQSESKTSPPEVQQPPSPPRLKPPTFGAMSAPPRPANGTVRPPPSAASSLRVPQTKVLSNTSMAPSLLVPPSKNASKQVILKPGHSPLDWAALTSNPKSQLRGKDVPDHLMRVPPSRLRYQNGRKGKDAWTVYQGKVYNITPYLPFHPGGEPEIMKGAGRDSAKLFMEVHPWVNWDAMLGECLVGILVGEDEVEASKNNSGLDEMD